MKILYAFFMSLLLMTARSEVREADTTPGLEAYLHGLKPAARQSVGDFGDTVHLSGSRGETLNFVIRGRSQECFDLKTDAWSGIRRSGSAQTPIRFYRMLPFVTEHPSFHGAHVGAYPDPLVPADRFCPSIRGGGDAWILGEFQIPSDLDPGDYETSVTGPGRVSIKLKVWGMKIPDQPAVPLYAELTSYYLLLGHYGRWHEGEAALSRKYMASMLKHRILPFKNWVQGIPVQGKTAFLRNAEGVASENTYYSTVVEPMPDWAGLSVPFPRPPRAGRDFENYFGAVRRALKSEGWLDRSYVYLWDEPEASEFKALEAAAKGVHRAAPDLRVLVTTKYRKDLAKSVDIFVPLMDHFDFPGNPSPEVYRSWQKNGKEFWLYASCMSHGCEGGVSSGAPDWVIDRPGTFIRSQAWVASLYHADGLLYYSVNNGYRNFEHGHDPWTDLWEFGGNGDGTLYYPGRPGMYGLNEQTPVESLRLKLWRQSSYDAEYIRWMNTQPNPPAWWPTLFRSLVRSPRDWSSSDDAYTDAREKMGEYLDSRESR